jgi:hypothetical protein
MIYATYRTFKIMRERDGGSADWDLSTEGAGQRYNVKRSTEETVEPANINADNLSRWLKYWVLFFASETVTGISQILGATIWSKFVILRTLLAVGLLIPKHVRCRIYFRM